MFEAYAIEPEYLSRYLQTVENASVEERAAALDMFGNAGRSGILDVSQDGREATVKIVGALSPNGPGPIARFFGFEGTAYSDIVEASELLADDPVIETVRFIMDTPGGKVSGMGNARQAIEKLAKSKKLIVENHGMIASAGYFLATPAARIDAMTPLAMTGSIGVLIVGIDASKAMERAGIKEIQIVSKNAPNKNPGIETDKGLEQLQKLIDAEERVFISNIAKDRGISEQQVIDNFGKGGLLIAQDPDPNMPDAVSVGMIDGVKTGASMSQNEGIGSNAGPTQFKDFPMVDRPWDSAAADRRVRQFLNAEDGPNQRYRQAFFWYDSANSENFGAYKLPFVDVVNGQLTAIWRGVSAANGAMSGARGQRVDIPEADRSRVQSHIDRYRNKWQRMQQSSSTNAAGGGGNQKGTTMDLEQLKAEHPAVYAQAVADGEKQERERAEAHLTLGEASGDMDLAVACIKDGTGLTTAISAKYQAAGMKKVAIQSRGEESEGDINTEASDSDHEDKALAQAVAEKLGVDYDG